MVRRYVIKRTGRPRDRVHHAPKEEATFDTELQRYVMPSERMLKARHE